MVRQYQIIDGKLVENGAEECPIQIYINPDDAEKNYLVNKVQIDEHTFNSALDPDELGRLEFEANHAAVIFKRPKRYTSEDNFLFKISSSGIFLFADKLIIIINEDVLLFEGRPFQKIRSIQDLFLKIIFRYIQHFEEHLNIIHKVSNEIEGEINHALTNKDLLYMFNLEKSLVYYLKAISSNSKVIEKIKANAAKVGLSQEENEFLEDDIIEAGQCYEEANTYLQVISNLMDAWVSMVSNNLNIRMKTLTILSICIMLPTFIVSLFSMNVALPMPQRESYMPFWIIAGAAFSSVLIVVLFWQRRKW
ncbi:MAG: magnesium transporter CorA family protein [Candidatus Omnitrophica bacterium]|nr:magnesium transporter CorA family protein [Candidatus Omnitrophota bacterium]